MPRLARKSVALTFPAAAGQPLCDADRNGARSMRLLRVPPIAVAVAALALTATGCGGSKKNSPGSTAGTTSTATTTTAKGAKGATLTACDVGEGKTPRAKLTAAPSDKAITARLPRANVSLSVKVDSARTTSSIPLKRGKRSLKATDGNKFVLVRFDAKNTGKAPVAAIGFVNGRFQVQRPNGKVYARSPGCRAATVVASTSNTKSPRTSVKPGSTATGIAVYVVPKDAKSLRWIVPGTRNYLTLKT